MATAALQCSGAAARTPALASGATTAKAFQRTAVRISQTRSRSSHVSGRRPLVSSEYSDRRGGGAGDFVVGFLLAGAAFGALAYILAPQISKSLDNMRDDRAATKRATWFLEENEGLERTLNEKIAQLNAAIDNVSAELRTEEGLSTSNGNNVELESAA